MSYVLRPVLVDFKKLSAAIGSGDRQLIASVKALDPERYEDDEDWDAEEEGEIALGQAIEDLIVGNPPVEGSEHQYGYALEEIACCLGRLIQPSIWNGVRWAAVEECELEDLLSTGSPIPLPENDDFPRIGHLHRADIDAQIEASEAVLEAADDNDTCRLLEEFLEWLDVAKGENLEVLLFYS